MSLKFTNSLHAPINPTTARILIVDDEAVLRDTLAEFLSQEGFCVSTAASAQEALELVKREHFDITFCDLQLPDEDGVRLLEKILQISPDTFVLVLTAYGSLDSAVEAFKRGAHDYLTKPVRFEELLAKLQHLMHYRQLHLENQWLRRELHRQYDFDQIIGDSQAMREVFALVSKVAPTRSTVLILGESGTGKELIARAIHYHSMERQERFLAVNCAAIPQDLLENQLFGHKRGAYTGADRDQEGLFVRAGRGTLFFDEIAEMPLALQAKLLRAIEQKEILPVGANEPVRVQARILAATNKDLAQLVEQGRFREDLYYRLNIVTIRLPPLRERREDIPALVEFFVARHSRELKKHFVGVDHEAMKVLMGAPWKGNVRELENVIQRAVILGEGPLITAKDLPPGLAPDPEVCLTDDLREAVAHFERQHIKRILRETPDKKEAARRLGVALSSLYRKIEELGIELEPRGERTATEKVLASPAPSRS
ncbi:MAG: sigma-54 dependent transcriptional regulator [Gemmatales bacterium]|nr:sigma-54 dependent transcriptional regulator [Gemmatales bacterium]